MSLERNRHLKLTKQTQTKISGKERCLFSSPVQILCNTSFLVSVDPLASNIDKPKNVNGKMERKEKQNTRKALARIIRSFKTESWLQAQLDNHQFISSFHRKLDCLYFSEHVYKNCMGTNKHLMPYDNSHPQVQSEHPLTTDAS